MNDLQKISQAKQWLSETKDLHEIKQIKDVAKAVKEYARAKNLGKEAQDEAGELIIMAGIKFSQMKKLGQDRGEIVEASDNRHSTGSKMELVDLGVTKKESHINDMLAENEDETIRIVCEIKNNPDKTVTENSVYLEKRRRKQTKSEAVAGLPDDKYKIIYSDPPWSYGNTMPSNVTVPNDYYKVLSTKDICAIPVKDILQDNAVLFLWTTSPHLQESFSVIEAWGFKYKTSFIWNKVKHNMGHYNSVRHEFLLVCVKGSCPIEVKQLFNSVQTIERNGKHSEKPEQFRTIIDTIYPNGKRIELFARGSKEGWETWGNESGLQE